MPQLQARSWRYHISQAQLMLKPLTSENPVTVFPPSITTRKLNIQGELFNHLFRHYLASLSTICKNIFILLLPFNCKRKGKRLLLGFQRLLADTEDDEFSRFNRGQAD